MRYKLILSYNGKGYNGWQVQKNKLTIQGEINKVLSEILNTDICITGSGRTDTSVSAIEQVAHFDYDGKLPNNFVGYINNKLPKSIRIASCEQSENFHARFDAKIKTYSYSFYISKNCNAYYDSFAYHAGICDLNKIKKAANYLIGTHDFSSFCASNSSVKDKTRTIYEAKVESNNELVNFEISGNGFLYNMVRIIIGTLVEIGKSKEDPKIILDIIKSKDRSRAGKTVPAFPLVLKNVKY